MDTIACCCHNSTHCTEQLTLQHKRFPCAMASLGGTRQVLRSSLALLARQQQPQQQAACLQAATPCKAALYHGGLQALLQPATSIQGNLATRLSQTARQHSWKQQPASAQQLRSFAATLQTAVLYPLRNPQLAAAAAASGVGVMGRAARQQLVGRQQRAGQCLHQQQGWQHARGYARGVERVDAAVLAKARKMSLPVGVLAGVFGSIVGVGGGIIIVPTIVNACKTIPQRVISGTSLTAVVATAAASSSTYFVQGLVDVGSAAVIASAAVLTAPLGARLTTRLNCTTLRKVLGLFLLCAAPLVPLKAFVLGRSPPLDQEGVPAPPSPVAPPAILESAAANPENPAAPQALELSWSAFTASLERLPPSTTAMMLATGCVAGTASGLLGIGGGVIVTPLLALLTDMPQAAVLGTSLMCMLPPSLVGLAQHARLGNVDWRMGLALACGSLVGGALGSNAALSAPPGVLEVAFTAGMLFLARKTLATVRRRA